jgi:hypothetical protein
MKRKGMNPLYQSFTSTQMWVDRQKLGPVHPIPPHWPYNGAPTSGFGMFCVVVGRGDGEGRGVVEVAGTEVNVVSSSYKGRADFSGCMIPKRENAPEKRDCHKLLQQMSA